MSERDDWPFGPELKRHRERLGLSVKAAARATGGKVSDGRWYQLESGYQKIRNQLIPIGTTAATVAAAAKAVNWDIDEALALVGLKAQVDGRLAAEGSLTATATVGGPLRAVTDEDLIAEVRRRMEEGRDGLESASQSDAPEEGDESQNSEGSDGDSDPDRSGGDAQGDDAALTVGEVAPSLDDAHVEVQGAEAFSKRPSVRRGNG